MTKRTTIYLDPKLHQAIKMKAVQMNESISDLISEALKLSLREDVVDLEAAKARKKEPSRSFENVLDDLRQDGLI